MKIDHFLGRLEKIRHSNPGFDYSLGKRLQPVNFIDVEKKLGITIPQRIKDFYLVANGLKTSNPDFELIELDEWIVDSELIHFATFDNSNKVYFKTSELNVAGEWTILNSRDNYEITLTISSFWSNKIWHWIEQNKKIWADNWWND